MVLKISDAVLASIFQNGGPKSRKSGENGINYFNDYYSRVIYQSIDLSGQGFHLLRFRVSPNAILVFIFKMAAQNLENQVQFQ